MYSYEISSGAHVFLKYCATLLYSSHTVLDRPATDAGSVSMFISAYLISVGSFWDDVTESHFWYILRRSNLMYATLWNIIKRKVATMRRASETAIFDRRPINQNKASGQGALCVKKP